MKGEITMKEELQEEIKEQQKISKATLARMPLYLHFLQEESSKGAQYISSTVIAQNISVSSVLVRKDLAFVSSEAGRPRLGFAISRLIVDIEKFLGYDNLSDAIIVGAGGLGRAFLGYEGFKSNGLSIVAAFDVSEKLIGTTVAGKEILPLSDLENFVKEHKISIGIITVPKVAAQDVLNKMVGAGIKAIWNFAPAPLRAPKDVVLKTEDLAASLAMLAGKLYRADGK
jgi:redox-sensing transcriptional repressor